jgi:hypothetical protein
LKVRDAGTISPVTKHRDRGVSPATELEVRGAGLTGAGERGCGV